MIELTKEQRQAIHASKDPLPVIDPDTQEAYVLLRADLYRELLEDAEDRREQKGWLDLATQTRRRWVQENPY